MFVICGSTVQLTVVEGTCSQFLGSCVGLDCGYACLVQYPNDGKGSCYYHNLCTCFFDRGPLKNTTQHLRQCNIGYGECNADCDLSCCNSKCKRFKDGIGTCVENSGINLCICHFSPQ